MNIENTLRYLVPEPKFYGRLFTREDFDKIQWVDARPKPTWAALVAAWPTVEAAENARAAKVAADLEDAQTAKTHPKVQSLSNLRPAQVQAWVDANVNTLADAKDLLKTLAVAVSVLMKRV